jgi:hypothetical protein
LISWIGTPVVGERRRVVAAQRVRVREAFGDACDCGVAAHDLGEGLLGDRPARSVAREAHEDDVVVAPAPSLAVRVHAQPRLQGAVGGGGDRDLALDVALARTKRWWWVLLGRAQRIALT